MSQDLIPFAVAVVAGIAWWLLLVRPRSPKPPPADPWLAHPALVRLGERLKAQQRPRPERAPLILPEGQSLAPTVEVPPGAGLPFRGPDEMLGRKISWRPQHDAAIVQLDAPYQSEAVVFDSDGDIVWAPEGAADLAWRAKGSELIEVGSLYEARPELRSRGYLTSVTPLQQEHTWFIARHAWPSRALVFQGEIRFPQGWAHELVLSPDERRACVVCLDQTEAGWLVIDVDDDEPVTHIPLFQRRTNLLGTPVFAPSEDSIASAAIDNFDWWLADQNEDENAPRAAAEERYARGARGGRTRYGWVFVQRLDTDDVEEHAIWLDLPAGFGAGRLEDTEPLVTPPTVRYVSETMIEVTLCHGPPQRFTLGDGVRIQGGAHEA